MNADLVKRRRCFWLVRWALSAGIAAFSSGCGSVDTLPSPNQSSGAVGASSSTGTGGAGGTGASSGAGGQLPEATVKWALDLGGDGADELFGVGADGQGNAYVVGAFDAVREISGEPWSVGDVYLTWVPIGGTDDAFLLKFGR